MRRPWAIVGVLWWMYSVAVASVTTETLIPSASLPPQAVVMRSNNNLDVITHAGDTYLAWRTAPSHFASAKTLLQVVRQTPGDSRWQFETVLKTGKDLREPRFLSYNGELFLYLAELGSNPLAFQPGRTLMLRRGVNGQWQAPVTVFSDGFIPWRIHLVEGRPLMIGYRGGENIYGDNTKGVGLYVLTTLDGVHWTPAFGGDGLIMRSGMSETDIAFTRQGLVAVGRNEAGDSEGWGSKICRASWADLASWTCRPDSRKFDSPLLVTQGDDVWLVARRQVAWQGRYDLGMRWLDRSAQSFAYQVAYSSSPKRCAVWAVDAGLLTVSWQQDLPSAGDTCFPSAISRGDGRVDIYNYTSDPVAGAAWPWIKGQLNPTRIDRHTLRLGGK